MTRLPPPLGGNGKVPMLVVLRIVFGMEVLIEGTSGGLLCSVGTEGVEFALYGRGVGRAEGVTDRLGSALFLGVVVGSCEGVELRRDSAPISWLLSVDIRRVLGTGNAGRGPFGGGRGVRGRSEVEVMVEVIAQAADSWCQCLLQPSARPTATCRAWGKSVAARVLIMESTPCGHDRTWILSLQARTPPGQSDAATSLFWMHRGDDGSAARCGLAAERGSGMFRCGKRRARVRFVPALRRHKMDGGNGISQAALSTPSLFLVSREMRKPRAADPLIYPKVRMRPFRGRISGEGSGSSSSLAIMN